MKKTQISLWAATIVMAVLLTACSGSHHADKPDDLSSSQQPISNIIEHSGSQSSQSSADMQGGDQGPDVSAMPTFSGDVIELFGLEWEDALQLMGEGSTTNSSQYIINTQAGIETSLTNTAEDLKRYTVNQVRINKDANQVLFHGIKIGDSLKETDKLLMGEGANYRGNLTWLLNIDDMAFGVSATTSDNKTIETITVSISELADAYADPDSTPKNSFAFTEDMHSFEPIYWE